MCDYPDRLISLNSIVSSKKENYNMAGAPLQNPNKLNYGQPNPYANPYGAQTQGQGQAPPTAGGPGIPNYSYQPGNYPQAPPAPPLGAQRPLPPLYGPGVAPDPGAIAQQQAGTDIQTGAQTQLAQQQIDAQKAAALQAANTNAATLANNQRYGAAQATQEQQYGANQNTQSQAAQLAQEHQAQQATAGLQAAGVQGQQTLQQGQLTGAQNLQESKAASEATAASTAQQAAAGLQAAGFTGKQGLQTSAQQAAAATQASGQQFQSQLLNQQGELQAAADQRNLSALQGLIGAGSGGAGGSPTDGGASAAQEDAARTAAFARAKDQAGLVGQSAMTALNNTMGARGLTGSGLAVNQAGGVINQGATMLGQQISDQAQSDVTNARQVASEQYQGGVTMRGQNLSALSGLMNARAY
jgi:hypothetical protein